MKPLVSILIPAYNAEPWIAEAVQSAVRQTWSRKEVIIVDDGSRDNTLAVAKRFASREVRVVSIENSGAAAARNYALRLSQGDYIQWLDADDLLAPNKLERQLAAIGEEGNRRLLLSCPWGSFYYRTRGAKVVSSSLCRDLTPVEWLLRKLDSNAYMQTATWLTSRELTEAAGPWDTRLLSDDDGEYFCRVLLASEGTRFVSKTITFQRVSPSSRLSYIGNSDNKKTALAISMKLHVQYLRSLEESERVRKACLQYLQAWYHVFYPERPDLTSELQVLATDLQGRLEVPKLRPKYAWMIPLVGLKVAKQAQSQLPQLKAACLRRIDRVAYSLGA
jgi:glycosyltransferase involved in cell wall biosynthesis